MRVEVDSLVKKFGKVVAVSNVTTKFGRGISIITGPNGAGKSTLLRCIDGLYLPDSGAVRIEGKDPYTDESSRYLMSLLTDNYSLYDNLTVMQNLLFFGKLYKMGEEETRARALSLLRRFDALQFANSKVYALSRGTKQKIALCRSLLGDPKILLLDEPTAFLDPKASSLVRSMMEKMASEGKTVIFVTQKVDEIPKFNARLLFLKGGKIVKDTTTYAFYRDMAKGAIVEIRLSSPITEKLAKSVPGFYSSNGKDPTVISVKILSYKEINSAIAYLAKNGAYVLEVDYTESIIKKFS
ncbi:MAG: ABC transporter ATP-binding protein [Candidatus Micrarchaeia archaeon]